MSIKTRGGAHSFFKGLLVAGMLTGGVAMTAPAYAINAPSDKISVNIDARDLQTDAGVERIYKTLSHKAKTSCLTAGAKPVSQRLAEQACVTTLLTSFVENIDSEKLNAYHYRMQSS